jgi:hypothetical protein
MADVSGTFYPGDAFIGYGAEIRIGQGVLPGSPVTPEIFVAIPDITTITPGDMTTGVVDVTHLRSPDRHRERKGTLRDSGPFTIVGNYRPEHGAHKAEGGDGFVADYSLYSLWKDVREANFEVELPPDASGGTSPTIVMSFVGLVTRYQPGAITIDEKVGFTAEITPLRAYDLGI